MAGRDSTSTRNGAPPPLALASADEHPYKRSAQTVSNWAIYNSAPAELDWLINLDVPMTPK